MFPPEEEMFNATVPGTVKLVFEFVVSFYELADAILHGAPKIAFGPANAVWPRI